MTVYITDDSGSLGNRLMESIHLNNPDGASVKLWMLCLMAALHRFLMMQLAS